MRNISDKILKGKSMAKDVTTDSDNETFSYSPLDSSFSYLATSTAFEIVPTVVAQSIPGKGFPIKELYGSPFESMHVNTRHVSGKQIDPKHAHFALSAGMMLGVRECVAGVNGVSLEQFQQKFNFHVKKNMDSHISNKIDQSHTNPSRDLLRITLEDECARVQKYEIPPGAHIVTSSRTLPFRYKFKAYAPLVFAKIRFAFGVEKQRFLHSICGKDNFIEFVSNAKSGQEIHKIWDLKGSTQGRRSKRGETVHKDLDIVDEGRKLYVGSERKNAIMVQLKKDTSFLAKLEIMDYSLLLGIHFKTINDKSYEQIHSEGFNCNNRSDLSQKQSSTNRNIVSTNDIVKGNRNLWQNKDSLVVREDYIIKEDREIMGGYVQNLYGEENIKSSDEESLSARDIREEMSSDVDSSISSCIWESVNVSSNFFHPMCTSLDRPEGIPNPYTSRKDLGIECFSGQNRLSKEYFYCGIIDILQYYNARKWGETIMRRAAGNQESQISCVDPKTYALRFVDFISTLLE